MDLNAVAVFVKVVEAESFTAAAAQLGLPKSSVSRTVSRLEEELGVRLLHRTTRQLHLTDVGRLYFEGARAALHGLEEAASTASNQSVEPRGLVRLAAPPGIEDLGLADIVARFRRKYPLVHVDVSIASRRVDLVGEGFDLAIRGGKLNDSTLIARKIGSDSLGVFASADYLRGRARPKRVADLAEHEAVLFRGVNGRCEWHLIGPNGEEKVTVRGAVNADDLSFVQEAVIAGIGIALMPTVVGRIVAKRSALPMVRLLPEYSSPGADAHIVMPTRRFQPAAVVLFSDFLCAELSTVWSAL